MSEGVGDVGIACAAGFLSPALSTCLWPDFGRPRTDGELFCESAFVVQMCAPSAQGLDGGPYKRLIFGCLGAFFGLAHRFEHLLGGSAFESLFLRAQ